MFPKSATILQKQNDEGEVIGEGQFVLLSLCAVMFFDNMIVM